MISINEKIRRIDEINKMHEFINRNKDSLIATNTLDIVKAEIEQAWIKFDYYLNLELPKGR